MKKSETKVMIVSTVVKDGCRRHDGPSQEFVEGHLD